MALSFSGRQYCLSPGATRLPGAGKRAFLPLYILVDYTWFSGKILTGGVYIAGGAGWKACQA